MPYRPHVIAAQVVNQNASNDIFQVVAKLEDRNECRLTFHGSLQDNSARPTHISRLLKEPCPICRKDYLCNCMSKYMDNIAEQSKPLLTQA